jgi:hypothetical protein
LNKRLVEPHSQFGYNGKLKKSLELNIRSLAQNLGTVLTEISEIYDYCVKDIQMKRNNVKHNMDFRKLCKLRAVFSSCC